jgi:hypothetical protein
MIATLHIPLEGDDGYTLTLNDEGQWVSSDWPQVADALNRAHESLAYAMPYYDCEGRAQDVAKRLGGEILYLKP